MQYKVGLVLSGGGARGLGHVGVLKALGEEGIAPDCISATSAGAIVGALWGAGHTPEQMLEFFETKNPLRLSKLALRKPGIIDTAKVVADFREYFPDDSFEALSVKLFLAATDIVNARLEFFTRGRLIHAILASASVPGVFTPTEVDGRWYLDGGIINNFPVEPLLGLCDVILGVYANPLRIVHQSDLKSTLAVSHRAFEVASYYSSRRKFHQCDLLLRPADLNRYGTFETKRLPEIVEVGYQAAREEMETIRRLVGSASERGWRG